MKKVCRMYKQGFFPWAIAKDTNRDLSEVVDILIQCEVVPECKRQLLLAGFR